MRHITQIGKALSDENRVRALAALSAGELCLCHLIEHLHLAPSTVSKHMSILKESGLVESRKQGRWQYYRLADGEARPALAWVMQTLKNQPGADKDRRAVLRVLGQNVEELCACYKK